MAECRVFGETRLSISFDTLGPGKRNLKNAIDEKGTFGPLKCKVR